jgi:hypothetical protein
MLAADKPVDLSCRVCSAGATRAALRVTSHGHGQKAVLLDGRSRIGRRPSSGGGGSRSGRRPSSRGGEIG